MIGIIVKCNREGCTEQRITSLVALTSERKAEDVSVWQTAVRLATEADGWSLGPEGDLEKAEFFCGNHKHGEATG